MNAPYDQDTEERSTDIGFYVLAWALATVYIASLAAGVAVLAVGLYRMVVG